MRVRAACVEAPPREILAMHKEWTISQLLDRYPTLGLPHFQRGHVWNTDAVSLLLESLFFDTPCGTIILWKPMHPSDQGIALPGCDLANVTHLIIDGQQRIRSIHDALGDISTDATDEQDVAVEEEDIARTPVWCLNLLRVPELAGLLDSHALGDKPIFMKLIDPRDPSVKRYKYNLIPLSYLRDMAAQDAPIEWRQLRPASGQQDCDVLAALNACMLSTKMRAIFDRRLVVIVKDETDTTNSLASMVQLYNRINSGGMRVQAEEKAFATLVSVYPHTNRRLRELFRDVHGDPGTVHDRLARDEVLRRTRENRFGFKLFMRAFVQAASHHMGFSLGSSGLSFEVLNNGHVSKYLSESDGRVDRLFDEWARVVRDTVTLLREDLYCDAFQFLPETASLVPIFQLLLKYPNVLSKPPHRKLGALYLLKLMLSELPQRDIFETAKRVRESNTLEECVPIIGDLELERLAENRLKSSNSLNDRYVLLLYWLERRRGAGDFSYDHKALCDRRSRLPDKEVAINVDCNPEKQHILPYSKLRDAYGITGRGRLSTHVVNNVGNLTYISRDLNHFETGLGDQPCDLPLEREKAPNNLAAHFLMSFDAERDVFAACVKAFDALGDTSEAGNRRQRSLFECFCSARRALIVEGFKLWVSELEAEACIQEAVKVRTEPIPQLFNRSAADRIRALNYHNLVEDAVLAMHALSGQVRVQAGKSEDGNLARFYIYRKDVSSSMILKVEFGRDDLTLEPNVSQGRVAHAIADRIAGYMDSGSSSTASVVKVSDSRYRFDCTTAGANVTAHVLRAVCEMLGE